MGAEAKEVGRLCWPGSISRVRNEITLSRFLPNEAYEVVADEIGRIQKQPPVGLLSVGLAVSLWLASSLFRTVIDTLNRIKGVREPGLTGTWS